MIPGIVIVVIAGVLLYIVEKSAVRVKCDSSFVIDTDCYTVNLDHIGQYCIPQDTVINQHSIPIVTLGMLSEASEPSLHFAGVESLQDVAVLVDLRDQQWPCRSSRSLRSAENESEGLYRETAQSSLCHRTGEGCSIRSM